MSSRCSAPSCEARVVGLDLEVARCVATAARRSSGSLGDEVEQLVDRRAVAAQQVLDPVDGPARCGRPAPPGCPQRLVAGGTDQRDPCRCRTSGTGRCRALTASVDGVLGHHPVGRVLAAGDDDQTRDRARRRRARGRACWSGRTPRPAAGAGRRRRRRRRRGSAAWPAGRWRARGCSRCRPGWPRDGPGRGPTGVSVVPMTQKSSLHGHGMMNSRLFSVSVISPVSELIRSRGTTMCTPLDACHPELALAADHLLDVVGPDAGGVDRHLRPGSGSPCPSPGLGPSPRRPGRRRGGTPMTRALVATCAP